jgi:hypothetical protein
MKLTLQEIEESCTRYEVLCASFQKVSIQGLFGMADRHLMSTTELSRMAPKELEKLGSRHKENCQGLSIAGLNDRACIWDMGAGL